MIVTVTAEIKDILAEGRKYPWAKPELCPQCRGNGVWGHGFVLSYFDGCVEGLWLRRYRCPGCGCIIKLKPEGYFPRFQASVESIRSCLSHRMSRGRWPPFPSKSRQRHWMRALARQTEALLGKAWSKGLIAAFDPLVDCSRIPVSRAIKVETLSVFDPPYRRVLFSRTWC